MYETKVRPHPWWQVRRFALLLLASTPIATLAATPLQKCEGTKTKAVGIAVLGEAKCQAKARQKEAATDPGCLRAAEAKLQKQFSKAEKTTPCSGDVADALASARACVAAFDGGTTGDPRCAAQKIKAAGKRAAGASGCAKKAALAGTAIDPACIAKVDTKFAKALANAERKGTCTGTADMLGIWIDACLAGPSTPLPCVGGAGFATCDGSCPTGFACQPHETFENGASVNAGCACVDLANAPECGGTTCSPNARCPDPSDVCERWLAGDPLGCDHMICQPAMTTPTTLPTRDMLECDGGEFPTCGGTCPDGERCQPAQALYTDVTFFAGCICVDPRGPRCDMPTDCNLDLLPFTHCPDPAQVCLVTLDIENGGDNPSCTDAHCGDPQPIIFPPTSTTTTIPTTTTTTSTSTTTSTTIPCTSTPGTSGCFQDLGDCTILDTCTGLQWEKKSDDIPGGLHDVNNRYAWAGCCDWDCSTVETHCQPNAEASATCFALADNGTEGCGLCTTGTCRVDPFTVGVTTTVWDWLNQVNGYGFAGHTDWRLAKEWGFNTGPDELETILLMPEPCTTGPLPCIDPIFGPTMPDIYWSATTKGATGPNRPSDAWFVDFLHGNYGDAGKWGPLYVRAVRTAE